jgi:hypothetical protein
MQKSCDGDAGNGGGGICVIMGAIVSGFVRLDGCLHLNNADCSRRAAVFCDMCGVVLIFAESTIRVG